MTLKKFCEEWYRQVWFWQQWVKIYRRWARDAGSEKGRQEYLREAARYESYVREYL